VLEIGPGKGALTSGLLSTQARIIAIEKDDQLFGYLNSEFASDCDSGRLTIIHGDIMDADPEKITRGVAYQLVANIPYNITGAIIEKFLSASHQPHQMVLLVQKEVAERIVAKDKKTGGPGKESILSIAVKVYGTPEYICTVKAGNFVPAPKVDSAVIKISQISRSHFINKHHEEVFFQLLKAGFAHKRKILAGNLKNILEPDLVEQALTQTNLSLTTRPEDVGISEWISLSKIVYNTQYGI
jgi:16S rRNA (adenine1518-N6/adenine1519-N6)-dimethyltransferase